MDIESCKNFVESFNLHFFGEDIQLGIGRPSRDVNPSFSNPFLVVRNSSIGDLVTQSLTVLLLLTYKERPTTLVT